MNRIISYVLFFYMAALLSSVQAFVPSSNIANTISISTTPLKATPIPTELFTTSTTDVLINNAATESSSSLVSLATLDPTTILSDVLGGLIGGPAILLVPIIAALTIAGVIAFLIVSYANPADEDD